MRHRSSPPATVVHPLPFTPTHPTPHHSLYATFTQPSTYADHSDAPAHFAFAPAPPPHPAESSLIDSSLAAFRFAQPATPIHDFPRDAPSVGHTLNGADSQGAESPFASSQPSAPLFLPLSPTLVPPLDSSVHPIVPHPSPVPTNGTSAPTVSAENDVEKVVAPKGSTGRPTRTSKKRTTYADADEDEMSGEEDEADQADDGGEYRPARKRSRSAFASTSHRRQLSLSSTSSAMSSSTALTSPATSPVRTTSTRQPLHRPLEVIDVAEVGEWTSETSFFGPWKQKEDVRVFDAHGNECVALVLVLR